MGTDAARQPSRAGIGVPGKRRLPRCAGRRTDVRALRGSERSGPAGDRRDPEARPGRDCLTPIVTARTFGPGRGRCRVLGLESADTGGMTIMKRAAPIPYVVLALLVGA